MYLHLCVIIISNLCFYFLVILPHIAGRNTIEAAMEKAQLAIDNIFAVFNNQPMPCQVKL